MSLWIMHHARLHLILQMVIVFLVSLSSFSVAVDQSDELASGSTARTLQSSETDNQSGLLITKANLEYVGAFRVPNYHNNVDEFSYGGIGLAYNPGKHSLFVAGHRGSVAEISIPEKIVNSSIISELSTSTILQPWTNFLARLPVKLEKALDGAPLGGLLLHDGRLIGTQYAYYSGANDQARSHFIIDSLNLSKANVQGLFKVGNMARCVAGYMTSIPEEWQARLGATHLTGQANVPIISTTSSGPCAFGFNANLDNDVNATPFLYYPNKRPLGPYTGPPNPIQNGNTSVNGVVFVPHSNSVLFFGKTGTNFNGYGTPKEYNDPYDGGKGPHSLNGEYAYQVWAYDVNDFVMVKNKQKQPWEILPYNVWNFDVPITHGHKAIGSVTFDPSSMRIYLTSMNSDTQAQYSSLPIIQVFQINLKAEQQAPQIGTLAATPGDVKPGPVKPGVAIMLTAGNVYGSSSSNPVKHVAFYHDSNNNGVLDETDQLLGNGQSMPQTNTWTLGIYTTNLPGGNNRVFVRASDQDKRVSNAIAATFQLMKSK